MANRSAIITTAALITIAVGGLIVNSNRDDKSVGPVAIVRATQPEQDFRIYTERASINEGEPTYGRVDTSFSGKFDDYGVICIADLRAEGVTYDWKKNRSGFLSSHLLRHLVFTGDVPCVVYVMPEGQDIFERLPKVKRRLERGVYAPEPLNTWVNVKKGSELEKTLTEGNILGLLPENPEKRKFVAPSIENATDAFLRKYELNRK